MSRLPGRSGLAKAGIGSLNSIEVDLAAVAHNTKQMRLLIGASRQLFVAVKGNAYGFGVDAIADATLSAGADALGLVSIDDAIRLRTRGVTAPILIYPGNLASSDVVAAMAENQLIATVTTVEEAEAFATAPSRVTVFVKINVGLERYGTEPDEAFKLIQCLVASPRADVQGIYTHLHIDESSRPQYLDWQFQRFVRVLTEVADAGIVVRTRMAASSPVLYRMPLEETLLNAVDLGHLIYGLAPTAADVGFDLRPAFRAMKSRLTAVREIRRTEYSSEGPFAMAGVSRIGVMPMGRIDAVTSLTTSHVLVRGRRVRLLGVPSMEHQRVDLTSVPDATVGDEVILVGRQGDDEITLHEVMTHQGVAREIGFFNRIPMSIPRVYVVASGQASGPP